MGETHVIERVAYVLPLGEGRPRWAKRIGPIAIGLSWRFSSFGIGVDVLRAGALIMIGPAFLWVALASRAALSEAEEKGEGLSDG